jgi:hypothetical protein
VSGATSYRFTITGAGISTPLVISNAWASFSWSQVPGHQLGASYSVKVALAFGGSTTFGNDGSTCTVTPTAPASTVTTQLTSAFCGQSVSVSQNVSATWVSGATSYRFTITGSGLSTPLVVINAWASFSWSQVPGYQLGATYSVKVALAFGGSTTFGNDGTPCNVTLIAPQLTTQSCTTQTYPSGGSSVITANTINGATGYRFRFTNSGGEDDDVYSTTNSIDMSLVGVADGTYTVTVAVAFGGTGFPSTMTYGTSGPGCAISFTNPTPLAQQDPQLHEAQTEGVQTEEQTVNTNTVNETVASITETALTATWTATATSNPFAQSFQVKLNGAEGITTDATFIAQLTDMSGKVYSQAILSKEQIEAESFGEQLAPGMYLMTLREGEQMQVLRVVKR